MRSNPVGVQKNKVELHFIKILYRFNDLFARPGLHEHSQTTIVNNKQSLEVLDSNIRIRHAKLQY